MDALEIICTFEGCELEAYPDPATGGAPWTIGWGSTRDRNGRPIKPGMKITAQEASVLLERDLDEVFLQISADSGLKKLPQGCKEAIASLCYNIGFSAFRRSKCYKAIVSGDLEETCRQWDWYKANGKFMRGLARRRVKELSLFLDSWK